MDKAFEQRFIAVRDRVDAEFRRNRKFHGNRIKCTAGCTDCCYQLFSISEMEAERVSLAFATLPLAEQISVSHRAKAYRAERESLLKEYGYVEGAGRLPKPHLRLACPMLYQGRCLIYKERPMLCRKIGMPVVHPADPSRVSACELNFRPGETFEDPKLVSIQTAIQGNWLTLLRDYRATAGVHEELPISVADAILS